jgi:methoxymalonate biosynthesis protein
VTGAAGGAPPAGRDDIRCVVWDLDGTLLAGVLLEHPGSAAPEPRPGVREVVARLHERGIVQSIASRNPPRLAGAAVRAGRWPAPFVAPQFGWTAKSDSVHRIAAALDLRTSTMAFVDDDPYERAEVAAALPDVLVLSPQDVAGALEWPRFRPAVVTDESRRRAENYRRAQQRDLAAQGFGGSRAQFRRHCRTTVSVRDAVAADVARLRELSVRTSRFNSDASAWPADAFRERLASPTHRTVCVRLRDRFADDGLVGAAVVALGSPAWQVELLMMSCRATGRGVIDVLLAWVERCAARHGAEAVQVPVRVNERNVPLRLALLAGGFRPAGERAGDGQAARDGTPAMFVRASMDAAAAFPDGIRVVGQR